MKKVLFTIFLFFYLSIGFSQDFFDQIHFSPFDENLPKRGVNSILEDQDGFMWFGLDGAGLFRADGNALKKFVYKNEDSTSINGNFVLSNYIDTKNRMWVGTNLGLNLYHPELESFQSIQTVNELSLTQEIKIKSIVQKEDDYLYLGTINYGLVKLDLHTHEAYSIPIKDISKTNLLIRQLIVYSGKIYAATTKGLMVFNEKENLFQLAEFNTEEGLRTITAELESLLVDKDNNLWLGTTKEGLFKINYFNKLTKIHQYLFTKNRIQTLLFTKDHQMYCGAENDGLFLIKPVREYQNKYSFEKFPHHIINSNSIWELYQDSQGRIWAGTFNKGVSLYDNKFKKFHEIINLPRTKNLFSRAISSIIEDDSNNLWIGLDGGGIETYNLKTKKTQKINTKEIGDYKGLNSDDIVSIFLDSKKNIWVGSWGGGIHFLKKGTKEFINYTIKNTNGALVSDRILSFSEDSKGRIWIGTFEKGLAYFNPQKNTFSHCNNKAFESYKVSYNQIRQLTLDEYDNIWLASVVGLFKVTVNEEPSGDLSFKLTAFKEPMLEAGNNHPSTNFISSIFITSDQQILIGTAGAGLFIYDKKEKFSRFEKENFQEETIGPIVQGKNNSIWVSGETGISHIDLKSNKVTSYNKDDGFSNNYLFINSIYSSKDGIIYYGNDLGLNCFSPFDIKNNNNFSKLHFTNFKIFNKEITPSQENSPLSKVFAKTKKITLDHHQKVFTIEYIGINFTRPEKNQYAYQLEGIDPEWRQVDNKLSATYTHLQPGDYTFKVKASNNDGIWTPEPLELTITMLAPWWKSNLAYLCYFLIFFASFFSITKILRERREEKHKYEMEHQRRLQEEKLNKKKFEFFTNISHQFKTPLTLIINPLKGIMENKNGQFSKEINTKHQIIYKNAHRLNRLINELMDFRKLQFNKALIQARQVEVISFLKETISYFSEEANQRNIDLKFEPDRQILIAWLDVSMIEKIIFNLITNAFIVTPNQGTIHITIQERQIRFPNSNGFKDGFEISIQDDGPGLTKEEINENFQPFGQVNTLINNQSGDTGIGLEVTKGFIELHKGKIEIDSKIGKGSTFTISFLLGKDHFTKEEISNQKYKNIYPEETLPTVSENPIESKIVHEIGTRIDKESSNREHTILIVEDNFDLRNYLKIELAEDYKILLAENGKEACEIAKKESPQAILTDVMMPIMDGIELCKEIKSDLQTSHIPILLLTARSTDTDKLQGINSGADAFLGKPIDMALLRSTLNQLLTSRQILFNKFGTGVVEPDQKSPKKITSLDNAFIKKMVAYIEENISKSDLTVESLASHFFLSRSQLYRKTKALTGVPVNEVIRKIRLEKASEMIKAGKGNISEISFKVGFSSPSYFAKCFKEEYGKPPKEVL